MGQVYRARDTKLDRDVALKVLPQAFTDDPDRLARFEREAKVLANLNTQTFVAARCGSTFGTAPSLGCPPISTSRSGHGREGRMIRFAGATCE